MTTQTARTDDSTLAASKGRDQRLSAFRAWGAAETGADTALVACYIAVARSGQTDPAEVAEARGWFGGTADGAKVPNASAKVYASNFNRAAKASAIIGETATVDAINAACKLKGKRHENINAALGGIVGGAKSAGVKEATKAQAKGIVKDALASIAAKAETKAAAKKSAPAKRGATGQHVATMATAAIESGKNAREMFAAVRLCSNNATRMAAPEGREAAWTAAVTKLQEACEAFSQFK